MNLHETGFTPASNVTTRIPFHGGAFERIKAALLYALLWLIFHFFIRPPFTIRWYRFVVRLLGGLMPAHGGGQRHPAVLAGVPIERVEPARVSTDAVLLYLHGGGFVLGSPHSHRGLISRLAEETGAVVYAPDYRLAPEHPYPAAQDDCLACYRALLEQGIPAQRIVVGGDSAGGTLSLALALRARELGLPQPAGLLLLSPATGLDLTTPSHRRYRWTDPLLHPVWLRQVLRAYRLTPEAMQYFGQHADLRGLPPMLIQVGEIEALYDCSERLATRAREAGVRADLEVYESLWHVFHMQARELAAARAAIARLAQGFGAMLKDNGPESFPGRADEVRL